MPLGLGEEAAGRESSKKISCTAEWVGRLCKMSDMPLLLLQLCYAAFSAPVIIISNAICHKSFQTLQNELTIESKNGNAFLTSLNNKRLFQFLYLRPGCNYNRILMPTIIMVGVLEVGWGSGKIQIRVTLVCLYTKTASANNVETITIKSPYGF